MLKRAIKISCKSLILLLGCAAIGTILMIGCYMLPMEKISEHVVESASIFENEGLYPRKFPWWITHLDNYTDAFMLLKASYAGEESVLDKALSVYSIHYENENPMESLITWCSSEKAEKAGNRFEYARYWHGYLIFLKPVLLFLNYGEIRILNFFVQFILTCFLLYSLYEKRKTRLIVVYILSVLLINPYEIALSMQFSTCFYLFTIASIIVVRKHSWLCSDNRCFYYFILIGAATGYFDFLTYPISTLGVPLIFYIILLNKDIKDWKYKVWNITLLSIGWFAGYAGMWGLKWIIGSALSSQNVIANALEQARFRLSMNKTVCIEGLKSEKISLLMLYAYNIGAFVLRPAIIPVIWYTIICIKKYFRNLKMNMQDDTLQAGIPLLVIAIMPLMWYFVLSNHSWIHYWFTNKALVVSVFAFLVFISQEKLKD